MMKMFYCVSWYGAVFAEMSKDWGRILTFRKTRFSCAENVFPITNKMRFAWSSYRLVTAASSA